MMKELRKDMNVMVLDPHENCQRMRTLYTELVTGYWEAWTPDGQSITTLPTSEILRVATKKDEKQSEETEAKIRLRDLLKPGQTIFAVLRHRSASGMSRRISFFIPYADDRNGRLRMFDLSWLIAKALNYRINRDDGGLVVTGAGMDMGYSVVYNLGYALYPNGFRCIGEGCPSNDHSNGDREFLRPHQHESGGYAFRCEWI